jgi:hypothetical protein
VPTKPTRRTRPSAALSSAKSFWKSMMVAFGYSSSGTMKTGKFRVSVTALSCLAKGSLSGPPSNMALPSFKTSTAPLSN